MARLAPFYKEVFLYTTFFPKQKSCSIVYTSLVPFGPRNEAKCIHIHVNTYPHLHHIPNINWLVVVA